MYAFWLVLTYDLLKDEIDDVIIETFFRIFEFFIV